MNPPAEDVAESHPVHCGMVAVIGRANVGKSTLVNALVEEKISIVSPVAQTTRNMIRGIWTEARGQLVFLDTPGLHKATHDLGRLMNRTARAATDAIDLALLVLDAAAPPRAEDEGWLRHLGSERIPTLFVLNKIDLLDRHDQRANYRKLWEQVKAGIQAGTEPAWMEVSATTSRGLEALRARLFEMMPEHPLLFPEDIVSDFPRKLAVADIIREKLFLSLRAELPYAVAVQVESIAETANGWQVDGVIYVNKESQKPIVIGQGGLALKSVRQAAERELTEIYERPVKLKLWVRVHKNWARDPQLLKQLGYLP